MSCRKHGAEDAFGPVRVEGIGEMEAFRLGVHIPTSSQTVSFSERQRLLSVVPCVHLGKKPCSQSIFRALRLTGAAGS